MMWTSSVLVVVPIAIVSPTFIPAVLATEQVVAVVEHVALNRVTAGDEVIPELFVTSGL